MQRSKFTAIAAAAFLAGVASVQTAQATSTSFRGGPVAAANEHGVLGATAIANDAALVNRIYNSMTVSVPATFDWTNSEIRIVLSQGSVYNAAPPGGTDSAPGGAALWSVPAFSPGAYDTFVNSKGVTTTFIAGKLNPDHSAAPPPAEGLTPSTPPAQVVSVAWGNTTGGEDGTFQVAQFVLSADAQGTFFGRTYATDDAGLPGGFRTFQGPVVGGLLVPEPSGVAGLLLLGVGLLRRRRRTA